MNETKIGQQQITKDILINDLIEKHPEVAQILMGYGLHCAGCHFSDSDTLELGAKIHGMDDETIKFMLKDVNSITNKKD